MFNSMTYEENAKNYAVHCLIVCVWERSCQIHVVTHDDGESLGDIKWNKRTMLLSKVVQTILVKVISPMPKIRLN